ncbi:hypothetical protein BH10CYA1_BH10CYA1_59240 [soil metagenome]
MDLLEALAFRRFLKKEIEEYVEYYELVIELAGLHAQQAWERGWMPENFPFASVILNCETSGQVCFVLALKLSSLALSFTTLSQYSARTIRQYFAVWVLDGLGQTCAPSVVLSRSRAD